MPLQRPYADRLLRPLDFLMGFGQFPKLLVSVSLLVRLHLPLRFHLVVVGLFVSSLSLGLPVRGLHSLALRLLVLHSFPNLLLPE